MLTAGATWYPDTAKTWSISALNRYEINSEQRDTHDTPGEAYTMEWGISKSLWQVWDFGIAGYYQQKVTGDRGPDPQGLSAYNRAAAAGPEVSVAIPSMMLFVSCRYEYEFMAENRAEGNTAVITVTKRF
jgi:hypothetical protein